MVICARCYSDKIVPLKIPVGWGSRGISHREICEDCGYMIVTSDELVIRAIKIKKIKDNIDG